MHPNAAAIDRFYEAFSRKDAEAMVSLYHPEVVFHDPVFPELRAARAGDMWRMLCEVGKDLTIEHRDARADDTTGTVHWEARYTFSRTGRKVHNVIDATFRFEGGKIIEHRDRFDFWRWAGMALGPTGKLLGWTPLVRGAVRKTAAKGLEAYVAKRR